MKEKPFEKIKIGEVFRDLDGNLLMRSAKAYNDAEGQNLLNTVVLISNRADLNRGELIYKNRDIYCELLNDREVSETRLVEMQEETTVIAGD